MGQYCGFSITLGFGVELGFLVWNQPLGSKPSSPLAGKGPPSEDGDEVEGLVCSEGARPRLITSPATRHAQALRA